MATIQIRNVPDDVARIHKIRAAKAGQSLQEYMLAQLKSDAEQPTVAELMDEIEYRLAGNEPLDEGVVIDTIDRARRERETQLLERISPRAAKQK